MSDEITTTVTATLKWVGAITAFVTTLCGMPFAWLHVRQNRLEDAIIKVGDCTAEMNTNFAKMTAHQEHMCEDIKEMKITIKQRRQQFKSNNSSENA